MFHFSQDLMQYFPFNWASVERGHVYFGWSANLPLDGGIYELISDTETNMMGLESHNWKLSIHRQDTNSSIMSGRLERVRRGLAGWRLFRVSMCWVALYPPTILLKLWADTKQFTIHPAREVHKAPMAGRTLSPPLPSDTFCFRTASVWFNLPQDLLVRPAWREHRCQCVKEFTWMIAAQQWLLMLVTPLSTIWEEGDVTKYSCFS